MINNGWINQMHTQVPGTDGKLSYGGMCFPKDTNALNQYLKKNNIPHGIINSTINERNSMRNKSKYNTIEYIFIFMVLYFLVLFLYILLLLTFLPNIFHNYVY